MRWRRPALLVGTVLALFVLPTAADLVCKASGYCSLGEVSPFVGDLYPSARVTVAECTQCSALLGESSRTEILTLFPFVVCCRQWTAQSSAVPKLQEGSHHHGVRPQQTR